MGNALKPIELNRVTIRDALHFIASSLWARPLASAVTISIITLLCLIVDNIGDYITDATIHLLPFSLIAMCFILWIVICPVIELYTSYVSYRTKYCINARTFFSNIKENGYIANLSGAAFRIAVMLTIFGTIIFFSIKPSDGNPTAPSETSMLNDIISNIIIFLGCLLWSIRIASTQTIIRLGNDDSSYHYTSACVRINLPFVVISGTILYTACFLLDDPGVLKAAVPLITITFVHLLWIYALFGNTFPKPEKAKKFITSNASAH